MSKHTVSNPARTVYEPREVRSAYALLLPALAAVVVFVLFPVAGTVWNSLFRDVSYMPREFVGIENFTRVSANPEFWTALRFTLLFTAVSVILEAVIGLSFALLLDLRFIGRNILRTVILVPWAIPTIVSAKTWRLVFDYSHGILNTIVVSAGLSDGPVNWLGTSHSAFWALVTAEVWKTTPFMVILLLAGLQAIPEDLYRQARVDGAQIWRRFYSVTLPLLRPVLVIALIFRTIDSLRIFDLVFVLTGGGPGGSTTSLSMLGYRYYVNDNFGHGSAVSLITFATAMAVTMVYLRAGHFRETIEQR